MSTSANQHIKINLQPITRIGNGDTSPFVLLCGDPERIPAITTQWTDTREVCRLREYYIITGKYRGVELTAASTGIGGPSTAILVEELAKTGAKVFIRVGNSGALADKVAIGDYVITTAAVRDDGTSRSHVIPEYPAVAHYEVLNALLKAAEGAETAVHTGITWSLDSFYTRNTVQLPGTAMTSMSFNGFAQHSFFTMVEDMKAAGVLNCEMESGTILTLASLFGLKAGCICTVSDRTPWPGPSADNIDLGHNMEGCISIALDAMLSLALVT